MNAKTPTVTEEMRVVKERFGTYFTSCRHSTPTERDTCACNLKCRSSTKTGMDAKQLVLIILSMSTSIKYASFFSLLTKNKYYNSNPTPHCGKWESGGSWKNVQCGEVGYGEHDSGEQSKSR